MTKSRVRESFAEIQQEIRTFKTQPRPRLSPAALPGSAGEKQEEEGMSESHFAVWETSWGWMGLVGSPAGIQRVFLPVGEKERVFGLVRKTFPGADENGGFFEKEIAQIHEYFSGARKKFQISPDFSPATPFQKKVYEILLTIPFGEIRTYGWVAREIGDPKALRAVGNANGKNLWPLIVPCHRVIGRNGFLTGFSAPGGLDLKARLLGHEGFQTRKDKVIPSKEQRGLFENQPPNRPGLPTAAR
jgi:methylated-DNA-[protein]-cysteine S-methyltransferase